MWKANEAFKSMKLDLDFFFYLFNYFRDDLQWEVLTLTFSSYFKIIGRIFNWKFFLYENVILHKLRGIQERGVGARGK